VRRTTVLTDQKGFNEESVVNLFRARTKEVLIRDSSLAHFENASN
jgi:hypothetical protein